MANQNNNGSGTSSNTTTEPAKWTIMVYMAADAVLAGFAIESLKQLRDAAGHGVVVAVQFDAPQKAVRRLLFDGSDKTGSINDHCHGRGLPVGTNMADPKTLADFIGWARAQRPCTGHCRYALVLWGHGPELLLDDYVVPGTKRTQKSFLTPITLREGLRLAKEQGGPTFDVLAADACSMSNLEAVCELQKYANYLIASQEEVPDFSFPYNQFLPDFQRTDDVARVCEAIPKLYTGAYQDFIRNSETTMKPVTLTSLALDPDHVATVTEPLAELTRVLLSRVGDEKVRGTVIAARALARSFVCGLYVDLYDFCDKLNRLAGVCDTPDLQVACDDVLYAIQRRNGNACILENQSPQDGDCHGLSIYFPYLDPDEDTIGPLAPLCKGSSTDVLNKGSSTDVLNKGSSTDVLNKNSMMAALNKGSSTDVLNKGSSTDVLNKGSSTDVLNKAGVDVLRRVRLQQIQETEGYYPNLKLAQATHWDQFITRCWSRWLAEGTRAVQKEYPHLDASDILDHHYSAQQCALNLLSYCPKPPQSGAYQASAPAKGAHADEGQLVNKR